MTDYDERVVEDVRMDLHEQEKIGVKISQAAYAYLNTHKKEVSDLYENGMSIEEIADYVRGMG